MNKYKKLNELNRINSKNFTDAIIKLAPLAAPACHVAAEEPKLSLAT